MLFISPTEFKCCRTGRIQYGYRIDDDCESVYFTTEDGIPDNDKAIFDAVVKHGQCVGGWFNTMLENLAENVYHTIEIGGNAYTPEELD